MKHKILCTLFLLFPIACQAEITDKFIMNKIQIVEEDLFDHVRHPEKNEFEIYKCQYFYLLGKLDAYKDIQHSLGNE